MTDVGTAFALYLDSQNFGDAGVNIFANNRPSTPHALIVCSEYTQSRSPTVTMGSGGPQLTSPSLQVAVRGTPAEDYDVVRARIDTIWNLLGALTEITLSGDRYLHVTPNDIPALIDKDDQERLLFVANFTIDKE